MAEHRSTLKNNLNMYNLPPLSFTPKTGMELPEMGIFTVKALTLDLILFTTKRYLIHPQFIFPNLSRTKIP